MSCSHHDPVQMNEYLSPNIHTWCTNCGNFGIHGALRRALTAEKYNPCEVLLAFDIGCHGNHSDKIDGYRLHGLHGRVLPLAAGAAIANQRVKVLAFGGDGATLAEGVNHLVAAVRHNFPITFFLHNNANYGLTTGQASPTTKPGAPMNSSPDGQTSQPLHAVRFVLSLQPTFVARTFSGDVHHMTETFRRGLNHNGFAFIEILQSCPTYNKATPHEWYQQRVEDVSQRPDYNPHDIEWARAAAEDMEEHVALGVLYEQPQRKSFVQLQSTRSNSKTELVDEVKPYDVADLFAEFT